VNRRRFNGRGAKGIDGVVGYDDDHIAQVLSGRKLERITSNGSTADSVLAQAAFGYQLIAATSDPDRPTEQ
jgi:hypothetical protein